MKKVEEVTKTLTIPKKLLEEIEAIISLTPGLDFNTYVMQAIHQNLRNSNTSQALTLDELKNLRSHFIVDDKEGHGPKA